MEHLIVDRLVTIESILNTEEQVINDWIRRVGFHNRKARYIKQATEIIHSKHKGFVPDQLADILSLPGVGQKMAHLLLQLAFGRVEGISVDTHVHRVSNRLEWVKTNSPEKTGK